MLDKTKPGWALIIDEAPTPAKAASQLYKSINTQSLYSTPEVKFTCLLVMERCDGDYRL